MAIFAATLVVLAAVAGFVVLYVRLSRREERLRACEDANSPDVRNALHEHRLRLSDVSDAQKLELARDLTSFERVRLVRSATVCTLLAVLVAVLSIRGLWKTEAPSNPQVYVRGLAYEGRTVEIPAAGLRLADALIHAGLDLEETDDEESNDDEEPILVSLRNGDNDQRTTMYVPLNLALADAPSFWSLENNDQIQVWRLEKTSLGLLESTEPGVAFRVTGEIDHPGQYTTLEVSEELINVHTSEYAGSFSMGPDGPDVMVVERTGSEGGPVERFLIPIQGPHLDLGLLESRIQEGDNIHYAKLANITWPAEVF